MAEIVFPISSFVKTYLYFDYVNYKGEQSRRRVRPSTIEFKKSGWHPEEQWLMRAYDIDKQEWREFAMKDMSNVIAE